MKSIRDGRIAIESGSKEEIDLLSKKITEKCTQVLEINIPKLWNPNIIIYDVPEDIITNNVAATSVTQNQELQLTKQSIWLKYSFKNTTKINDIIAVYEPQTWQILTQRKVKCRVANYVKVIPCSTQDWLWRIFKNCSPVLYRHHFCSGILCDKLQSGDNLSSS